MSSSPSPKLARRFESGAWHPLLDALGVGAACFLVSTVSLGVLYRQGSEALREEVHSALERTARTAAALVDGDLHRTFVSPGQELTPEYERAVAPLRRILRSRPDLRFVYTMTLFRGTPCIVLDATPAGDADGDGVEDHSPLLQPYETPAPALLDALRHGRAQTDAEPVKDRWGTYLSGYAPVLDSAGRVAGIVGVDLRLDAYESRLAAMRRAAWLGLAAALGPCLLIGLGAWWLQRRTAISEQRRAEAQAALQASQHDYQQLFDQMHSGFAVHEIVCDDSGKPVDYRFLAANPAFERLTGLSPGKIVGKTVKEVLPGIEAHWIETYGRVALTGAPAHFESYNQPLDRYYEVSAYRPAPGRFACIFVDATERRKVLQQLQHVQKLEGLGLLAGGIAHDFNNLLMGILGHADLALEECQTGSAVGSSLEQIKQIVLRAADLCRQMLAYSGKGRFVVGPVDLTRVVVDMTNLLEVSISKKAAMRFNLADRLPAVEADASQLRQVVMNLVINAAEAIGQRGGVISVTTGRTVCDEDALRSTYLSEQATPGTYVFLEVADTGCGMDESTRARIFDPFFTTKFTGRGLGLAAVMGIVRGHKGAIKVQSEPGKGSVFTIFLPACEAPAEAGEEDAAVPNWRGSGVLLIVDDEEWIRSVARSMAERTGFSVLTATNGRDAIDLFQHHAHELSCVLMDLTMPHMDGDDAFQEMHRINPHVPIILSSGYNQQDVTQRLVGRGLAGFLQKPYPLAQFVDALRKAVSSRRP